MNIYFSENLKELRRTKKLTQERLADFLGVAFQTVSKWERGETYPDISMLPEIAGFFGVSVDALLGVNRAENEAEITELLEKYDNLTDEGMRLELLAEMLEKYPTDFRIQLRQLGALIFHQSPDEQKKSISKVNTIYNNIQENCTVDTIRICAKRYLANYYMHLSYVEGSGITHKDCERVIDEMPHMRDGKEFLASYLFEFKDPNHDKNVQEAMEEEIGLLLHGISHHIHGYIDNDIPLERRIEVAELEVELINKFYDDGNYGCAWRNIMYTYGHLGHLYYELGDEEKALDNLTKSAQLAKKFDDMDRYTTMHSKFFNNRVFDKHTLGSTFIAKSRMKYLMTERYPFTPEFKESLKFRMVLNILTA